MQLIPYQPTTATIIPPTSSVDFCRGSKIQTTLPHKNRLPFEGVLTFVDSPSDKAPSGARGHRVILTRAAAEAALPSLIGMAVDYKVGWDGHDSRQKCGIITAAKLDGDKVLVAGFIYAKDFPEIEGALTPSFAEGKFGMSYELVDAHVDDMRSSIWRLTKATFSGAAILLRDRAAYSNTSFQLLTGERARHADRTIQSSLSIMASQNCGILP